MPDLFLNDFNRKQKIAWNAAMILSFIFYFIGFNFYSTGGPSISYGLFHPANAFQYSLVLIGSVFPPSSPRWGDLFTREVIGAFLFVLSGFILVQARKRVVLEKPLLAPLALMMFAFLFDASITIGRAAFGLIQAPSSRYTSANLVLMISIYLLLFHFLKTEQGSAQKKNASRLFYFYLLILGCQFAISLRQGMDMGKDLFQKRTAAQELLINYEIGAPELIARYLYPHPNILRRRAAVLERSHSNVFSTWIGNALLPIPKTLGPLLKKDRASLLAWRLLSTVYFFRADLQKRYPPTPEVEDFISKIAAWAVEYGLTRDKDREFLWPGKKQLIKINEILHPADQTKKS